MKRWRAVEPRWKFLVLLGGALCVFGALGWFGGTRDIELTEAEALTIAEEYLDFEPEVTELRVVRQGFFRKPVWAVNFRIPDPEGSSRDFLRHLTVEVDAIDGDVLRIGTDGIGDD